METVTKIRIFMEKVAYKRFVCRCVKFDISVAPVGE